jgi:site-specific DNA-cytosine methylase
LIVSRWFFPPVPVTGENIVIDLCAGTGGWTDAFLAEGCTVVGYDIRRDQRYKGHLILADVRELDGRWFSQALVIVASPPCTDFSLANPKRRDPAFVPDLSVVEACFRIGRESGRPIVIENVCGAQKWLGAPVGHYGKFYLWGDGVPAMLPQGPRWKDKYKMRNRSRHLRARIPFDLAAAIAHDAVTRLVLEHR